MTKIKNIQNGIILLSDDVTQHFFIDLLYLFSSLFELIDLKVWSILRKARVKNREKEDDIGQISLPVISVKFDCIASCHGKSSRSALVAH